MPKVLGANIAERAFRNVCDRIGKPGPCSPPKSQRADNKTCEERGAALLQNSEDVSDTFKGGGQSKVFEAPSISPFEEEIGQGCWVHNLEEDLVGFFLRFFREFRQDRGKLNENRVVKGSIEVGR